MDLLLYLAKYQYRLLRASRNSVILLKMWWQIHHEHLTLTLNCDLDSQPWPLTSKQFERQSWFDLDLWPTTLIYNPSLAKVKVNPHAKNQGKRSNCSKVRASTDWQTDGLTNGRYQTYYLPCFAVDKYGCLLVEAEAVQIVIKQVFLSRYEVNSLMIYSNQPTLRMAPSALYGFQGKYHIKSALVNYFIGWGWHVYRDSALCDW